MHEEEILSGGEEGMGRCPIKGNLFLREEWRKEDISLRDLHSSVVVVEEEEEEVKCDDQIGVSDGQEGRRD